MHSLQQSIITIAFFLLPIISASEPVSDGGYPGRTDTCFRFVLPACSPASEWSRCRCDKKAVSYNVSQINSSIGYLTIGSDRQNCDASCLLNTFVPLPRLPRVWRVGLFNIWVAPDNQPFPLQRFLVNVKAQVTSLLLWDIYLPVLTRDTLAGFGRLDCLSLQRNQLSSIALDTFQALTPLPLSGNLSAPAAKLSRVSISENNLTRLDWSVWKPLAGSLTAISLEVDEIREISLSSHFVLPRLQTLDLPGNQLEQISDDLLASVTSPSGRPYLRLEYNPLCLDPKCGCASMGNLWAWYQQRTRLPYPDPHKYYPALLPDALTCGNYTLNPWPQHYALDKFRYIANVTRYYFADWLLVMAQRRSGQRLTDTWLPTWHVDYLAQLAGYLSKDYTYNFRDPSRENAAVPTE